MIRFAAEGEFQLRPRRHILEECDRNPNSCDNLKFNKNSQINCQQGMNFRLLVQPITFVSVLIIPL
jgi:hypothetical protein